MLSTTPYDNSPTFIVPPEYATQGGQKGPHNIPFDIDGVSISTVRSLMDVAGSADQFLEMLQKIAGRL